MPKLELTCEQCGTKVYRYPSQIKKNVFCSKECGNLYRRTLEECECEICGKRYRKTNKADAGRFCSKECYNSQPKEERVCEYCGEVFNAKFHKNNPSKYCSMECYNESRKADETSREGMWKWSREVYKKHDYKCANCGSTEDLCAHHIYAFKFHPEKRADLENGICYCDKCHKLVHNKYGYHKYTGSMLL